MLSRTLLALVALCCCLAAQPAVAVRQEGRQLLQVRSGSGNLGGGRRLEGVPARVRCGGMAHALKRCVELTCICSGCHAPPMPLHAAAAGARQLLGRRRQLGARPLHMHHPARLHRRVPDCDGPRTHRQRALLGE